MLNLRSITELSTRRWFPLHWLLAALIACSLLVTPAIARAAQPAAPHAQGDEAEWLVMIYSDADDNILEEDMMIDLQEAELIGSTDDVTIVAQTDRFKGSYNGMGNWTGAKRFLITEDDDMDSFGSEEIEDLGEISMSDGETLLDFIEWAVSSYPARKHMLILSDHGAGWPGGWTDPDPGGTGDDDIILAQEFGDSLWLMEIDRVLGQAREDLGLDYFDVVGFDACLMSQLEVYTALAPHALYSVASEEVEPGLGWAYAAFLAELVDNPGMDGAELSSHVVDTYIDGDMRLDDPDYVGDLTRQQAANEITPEVTLTAVDLAQIAPLNDALNGLVVNLQTLDDKVVAAARAYAQDFESVFGDDVPSPYIDLGHFSQLIQSYTDDNAVLAAAAELDAAIDAAVIAERHGPERPGATGIAIYFPVRTLYEIADNLGYVTVADRFAEESQWDEFIAFHSGDGAGGGALNRPSPLEETLQELLPDLDLEYIYTLKDEIEAMIDDGLSPEEIAASLVDDYELPEDVVAELLDQGLLGGDTAESAPAPSNANSEAKPLQVAPIRLSAEVTYPGEPVTVETDVEGDRVAFVYSFIGRFLPEDDILIIEDQDFLFADEDTTVGGVTYPQWPEGSFTVAYDWEPTVYAISDGTTSIRTLFSPATYGDEPTYTVEGIFTFANGSPDRYARLFFRNGELAQTFAFVGTDNDGTGAPREITPEPGDQFTVLEQGYNLAEDAEDEMYSGESGTLTFGDEPFYIEETPAPSGNYVVGVIAEDLDGNQVESYEGLFVVGEDGVTEEGFVPLVADDLGFALLHPESWGPVEGGEGTDGYVQLTNADETATMHISIYEYPDAADELEANLTALDDVMAELADNGDLEDVQATGDPYDYTLGYYAAQLLDFAFVYDGVDYTGEIIAATPTPGVTYVVYFEALADEAEALLPDLDAVLYSFDLLMPGVDFAEESVYQPEYAELLFEDDYSDAASGLYDDVEEQDWGMGYYDPEIEQYVYAMNPASGAIYDYYADLIVPDTFMIDVYATSAGAINTAYGLIFQVQDDDHFYAFRVSGDGYFLVEKADGDSLETLVDWTVAEPFDVEEEAVNTLAVVGSEGYYALFVNGVMVGDFEDASYGAGSAGYLVENFDEETPAAFAFDDFWVGVPVE